MDETPVNGLPAGADRAGSTLGRILVRLHPVCVIVLAVASVGLGACGGGGGGGHAARISLSGTVNGLRGSGLAVAVNSGLPTPLAANGPFTLPGSIPVGSTYSVRVVTQPKAPSQTCVIANGDGQAGASNITSIVVTCITDRFTIGGTLAGLIVPESELVLANRLADGGLDELNLTTNGPFTFKEPVESGSRYEILEEFEWLTDPVLQFCRTDNRSGTVGDRNVTNVSVTCTSDFPYTLGGTMSGLRVGSQVPLLSFGDGDANLEDREGRVLYLLISSNGPFTFPERLASGEPYNVSVNTGATSDPLQSCIVENGRGTVAAANVTSLVVTCRTATFAVGGTVIGLTGSGLVLQNNGVDDLRVSADGAFVFATPISSAAAYNVTVLAQPTSPAQTCYVTRGSGVIDVANVDDVLVNCHARIQTVSGIAQGVTGTGIVLRNNDGDDLLVASDGRFSFETAVATGSEYHVTVHQQPTDAARHCSVSNGVGIVGTAGVSDIRVQCKEVGRRIYVPTTAIPDIPRPSGIYMFAWDPATERFQLLAGSPIPHGTRIATAPDGTFAVVHLWQPAAVDNRLATYRIDLSTGELVPVPDAASLPLDATLVDAAIDPSSKHLYFAQYGDDRIFAYAVDSTGSITAVPGGRAGRFIGDGGDLAFDPQGRFLFVANATARTISAFAIDRNSGALAEFAGSPYSLAFEPRDLNVEPEGRYLYVTSSTAQLVPYVIEGYDGSTGSLRPASAAPFTPASTQGGLYAFDPNSNRVFYLAWCRPTIRGCPTSAPSISIPWGLWRLTVDETGAVHPLGDAEVLSYLSEFNGYESLEFDASGNFVCTLMGINAGLPYSQLRCSFIDATTGALGRDILDWRSLDGSTVTSIAISR